MRAKSDKIEILLNIFSNTLRIEYRRFQLNNIIIY